MPFRQVPVQLRIESADGRLAEDVASDDTLERLRFHDLRGTGLTWMAIRGDDPLKIQQRAGYRTFEMT